MVPMGLPVRILTPVDAVPSPTETYLDLLRVALPVEGPQRPSIPLIPPLGPVLADTEAMRSSS